MIDNKRFRNFALISYLTEEEIKYTLTHNENIKYYAYILHNCDKDSNGNDKISHFHIIVNLCNACTCSAIRKIFPKTANTLSQPILDKSSVFDYLTHEDNPEKYHYDKDLIISNNIDFWKVDDIQDDTAYNIISDINSNTSLDIMLKRYGRDYIINYTKYNDFAHILKSKKIIDTDIYSNKDFLISCKRFLYSTLDHLQDYIQNNKKTIDTFEIDILKYLNTILF